MNNQSTDRRPRAVSNHDGLPGQETGAALLPRRALWPRPDASAAATFTRTPVDFHLAGEPVFGIGLQGIDHALSGRAGDARDPVRRVLDVEGVLCLVELQLHRLVGGDVVKALCGKEA